MSDKKDQPALFEVPPDWEKEWQGMPEFGQQNLMPQQTVMVHFANAEDRREFAELIGQPITDLTKYVWYPRPEKGSTLVKRHEEENINPRYPVYVISKGRWESRLTVKALESMNVPYHIVIEPQEYEQYSAVIDCQKILILPFSNLGQGSIPARNWVWEHSILAGAERHWILDDNIGSFMRLHHNTKSRVTDGSVFVHCERFTDRYSNVAISGMNYQWFAKQRQLIPPFIHNTRVYSCILIQNSLTHRWRGRYNEDTDLCLRVLKDGSCTVLFNAFLADKMTTMTMKGGNTDTIYAETDQRKEFAESLREQHPDVVEVVWKFGRWHHQVNYLPFKKNKLIRKPDIEIQEGVNNYGMKLEYKVK